MVALAYILLPVSGLVAYLTGRSRRVRLHGLQAIALGLVWPAALYGCTYLTPGATQICAVLGGVVWIGFLAAAALGADPLIPLLGRYLERAARDDPRAVPGIDGSESG